MRASGILMHISSLPGPYGIGTMGEDAYKFVDFLEAAGQRYWQLLPLCPTGYGDSPYQSFSTFAGSHYLIDLERLVDEGLLTGEEVEAVIWCRSEEKVDYGALYENRCRVLRKAYDRFAPDGEYRAFLEENRSWLPDYSLFMALKEAYPGGDWLAWPKELRLREPEALEKARKAYEKEMDF